MSFRKILAGFSFALAFPLLALAQESTAIPTVAGQALPQVQEAEMFSATLDKNAYVWGELITVSISLSPKNEVSQKGQLVFDAVIKNKNGEECAVITKDQPIRTATETLIPIPTAKDAYTFILPSQRNCNAATVSILLKTQGGAPIGVKDFAVSVSAPAVLEKKPTDVTVSIGIFLALVVLGAVAYFIWRKKKSLQTN